MMVYNIEFYAYLPKTLIYFFLYFDFRSDPDTDHHPCLFIKLIYIVLFQGDGYKMLSWGGAVSLILSGQPNLPAQTKQFNLDIDTFFEGLI